MGLANELIGAFFRWGDTIKDDPEFFRKYQPESFVYMCAKDVERVARTAWHPVSEPPTEADGDEAGNVIARTTEGILETLSWDCEAMHGNPIYEAPATHWARIRDVVLMPPEDA